MFCGLEEERTRLRKKKGKKKKRKLVVVAHIYPPVTGQRQTLTYWTIRTLFITTVTLWLEESAHAYEFPMIQCFRGFPRVLVFLWISSSSCPLNLLLACSKPPSRDNHRKASYPRTQQRDQGAGWTQTIRSGSSLKQRLYPFGHAADILAFKIYNHVQYYLSHLSRF